MDKITYLAELAEGLARWVPERERQDILRYYAEYFEEAGFEREAEVVAELGDPWALSCRLAVEGGYVTWEKAASWTPRKRWPKVLIGTAVGLTVFALVAGMGLVGALAFNVVRGVTRQVIDPFTVEASVVDWGFSPVEGEFGVAYVDDPEGVMGYYYMEGENVASFHSIDIDVGLGNIQVVAGDAFTLSVSRSETLRGYEPTWEVANGVLKLRDGRGTRVQADSWDELKNLFGVGQGAMEVIITVPANAALNKISAKTGLGNVLVYGVCAETVTADTGLGDVECYEARSIRTLGLTTGMGDVILCMGEALDGLYIGLKTGMGNVEATLCGFETDYSYSLESGLGAVTVNGSYQNTKVERRGNQPYQLNAASGMGDVSVNFSF